MSAGNRPASLNDMLTFHASLKQGRGNGVGKSATLRCNLPNSRDTGMSEENFQGERMSKRKYDMLGEESVGAGPLNSTSTRFEHRAHTSAEDLRLVCRVCQPKYYGVRLENSKKHHWSIDCLISV